MIVAVGLDIVNVQRFEILSGWSPRLIEQFQSKETKITSLAGEFAARAALIKTMNQLRSHPKLFNLADSSTCDVMRSVSVVHHDSGIPQLVFLDPYKNIFRDFHFMLSISHDPPVAAAVVVAVSQNFNEGKSG